MALTARTFFVLVSIALHELVITAATFQLQSTWPNSSSLPLPVPLPAPSVVGSKNQFVIRKCCGPGQLYNYNAAEDIPDADRCVKFSISSSHRRLPAVQKSRDIFLGSKQSFPPGYGVEDVQVNPGFPRSCTPDGWDFLEPELRMGDLFYALSSGQLLVPHQFYFLEFDSYCIEDYADERNVTKARRMAFMCFMETQKFPTTAIDSSGKLRLDFVKSEEYGELFASKFNGRRVIRKCCRQNSTLDSTSEFNGRPRCRENQGLVTPFFENLRLKENSTNLFFRFGYANCSYPTRTKQFQLNSNGSLEIQMGDTIANSSNLLVSIEDYCLDDMVEFSYVTGLPFTSTYALYCPSEEPNLIEPEFTDELTESPFTDAPFTDAPFTEPTFTDTTISEPESTYSNNDDQSDNSTLITIPKCCPPGHVMNEDYTCQPLWWWPSEQYGDEFTEPSVVVSGSINYDFTAYHNNWSVIFVPDPTFNGSCKPNQLQQPIPLFAENSQITPIFGNDSKGGVSLSLHAFVKNYWDVKSQVHSFCVDQLLFKQEREVYYNPQVFHCLTIESFKSHRPAILLISTVGLLATFIIYLLVPASGSAKMVITAFGGKKNSGRSRKTTMAMMLTGRILLCHVISLALAFICLAIGQLKLVESGESSCVALGYITYWAFIASFSWLTVYCFDYYHIFNGSFKVTNDGLFIPYSAFGWGVPFLAMIITIIAQFQSTSMGISGAFNPNFGYDRCWFPDESSSALILFFYVPVGILLLLDIYFFLSLMFNANLMHCWQRQQDVAIRSNRKSSSESKEQEDLKMAVKLFFITGIPWIFELIGYLAVRLDGLNLSRYYFFEFCVIFNTSRGVFIFVNFILLNRDVRNFLWSRVKIISKRETLGGGNVTRDDFSTSNATTQISSVTCSETISSVESAPCDDHSFL